MVGYGGMCRMRTRGGRGEVSVQKGVLLNVCMCVLEGGRRKDSHHWFVTGKEEGEGAGEMRSCRH